MYMWGLSCLGLEARHRRYSAKIKMHNAVRPMGRTAFGFACFMRGEDCLLGFGIFLAGHIFHPFGQSCVADNMLHTASVGFGGGLVDPQHIR